MENIVVALTNYPVIYSIDLAFDKMDYLTGIILLNIGSASFLSHLIENHKHGMPGIGFSSSTSYYLNRWDVISCILVAIRFGYLYWKKYDCNMTTLIKNKSMIFEFVFAMVILHLSECDRYNPKLKYMYIILHGTWHLKIFNLLYHFLDKVIYTN